MKEQTQIDKIRDDVTQLGINAGVAWKSLKGGKNHRKYWNMIHITFLNESDMFLYKLLGKHNNNPKVALELFKNDTNDKSNTMEYRIDS